MEQNRTGKYLKYAIGEIVLVVIGILIALSINTWNEDRKEKEKEKNILTEINETLSENQLTLESAIEHMKISNNSSQIVLRLLNDSLNLSDTLSIHFDRAKWTSSGLIQGFSNAGYIGLSNLGFDLLSNSNLRKLIIRYFTKDYQVLISTYNSKSELYANYDEYVRRHFIDLGGPKSFPVNPETILNDNYYRSIISTIYDHRIALLKRTQAFYDRTNILINLINKEIELLK